MIHRLQVELPWEGAEPGQVVSKLSVDMLTEEKSSFWNLSMKYSSPVIHLRGGDNQIGDRYVISLP